MSSEDAPSRGQGRIVVGIDGSDPSKEALRWAVRQAKLTGAPIDAVIAWRYPAGYGWSMDIGEIDLEGDARRALTAVVDEVRARAPEVTIRPAVAEGPPADVLVRASADADLLVVSRRGHGAFASAVLGSVSLGVVLHAKCPVLVVQD